MSALGIPHESQPARILFHILSALSNCNLYWNTGAPHRRLELNFYSISINYIILNFPRFSGQHSTSDSDDI